MESKVYLSIGSNKGNRVDFIQKCLQLINSEIGLIIKLSSLYETDSWEYDDKAYLNCALEISTNLSPFRLLQKIHETEKTLGRTSKTKFVNERPAYESRVIDIDILFYENKIINQKDLIIPHQHLHKRKFVLIPLSEICSDFLHPVLKKTVKSILKECSDKGSIKYYDTLNFLNYDN